MGATERGHLASRHGRVLVVDDDVAMCAVLCDVVAAEGFRAFAEPDADRVPTTLDAVNADVVVLDVQMPRRSGLDLLADIKRRHPHTAVIVITAFGAPGIADQARRLGAAAYLDKPFRMSDLLDKVARALHDAPGKGD